MSAEGVEELDNVFILFCIYIFLFKSWPDVKSGLR